MILSRLVQAMAWMEGWYAVTPPSHPNRPQRNNNPGNIEWSPWTKAHGALRGDPLFAIWGTQEGGWHGMVDLLLEHYGTWTIEQMIYHWAPPSQNNTALYLQTVCHRSGLQPTDIVNQHV